MKTDSLLRSFERVLMIAPHTDDEFGSAGVLHRFIRLGVEVRYVALSRCEDSVPEPYPKDILGIECLECTRRLGIPENNVDILDYPVRHFPAFRQDILEDFVKLNREYRPDLVLLPSTFDTHQDHSTVSKEGFRAFKFTSIWGYELAQNLNSFSNTVFIALSDQDIEQKVYALSSYVSQSFRSYSAGDYIKSLARVRGIQSNAKYAEAFELIRLIVR